MDRRTTLAPTLPTRLKDGRFRVENGRILCALIQLCDSSLYLFPVLRFLSLTTESLASTMNFTEINYPVITPEDHWKTEDCEMPLPAIYKCCINSTASPMPETDDIADDDDDV